MRLADCRRLRMMSQAELAAKADVAPATIYKLEKRRHTAQPRIARKIAEALQIDPGEIDEFKSILEPKPD